MTCGENSIQLPDGEELVMVEYAESQLTVSSPDPREASLDLRRQAVQTVPARPTPAVTSQL